MLVLATWIPPVYLRTRGERAHVCSRRKKIPARESLSCVPTRISCREYVTNIITWQAARRELALLVGYRATPYNLGVSVMHCTVSDMVWQMSMSQTALSMLVYSKNNKTIRYILQNIQC